MAAEPKAGEEDPPCPVCRGILKSSTVYFGEGLNSHDLDRSFDAASHCDVLLAVGTTLQVFPIAEVVPVAKKAGATIVIVNGEPTAMDRMAAEHVTEVFTGHGAKGVPAERVAFDFDELLLAVDDGDLVGADPPPPANVGSVG